MASRSDLSPRAGRRARWATAVILAGLIVIVLLATGYFFVRSIELEEAKSLAESEAIARGVAAFIEAREEGYRNILLSYAGRFRFREVVKRRDRAAALVHLRQLTETFPELDWPFLAGPDGVLWAIYPEAPELYGRSFAHRDWYRGVSREWRSYMSEIFPAARDQAPVVSLVMPIRDLDGKVIGIIGSAQRLDVIRQWLLPIQVPDGDLYVVDRKGQLVFHRTRFGPEQINDYSRVPVVERLLRGEEGVVELENPVEGQVRLSAYRLLPSLGWGVVVDREKNLVLQRTRTLIFVSGTAGILLAGALAFLGRVALRNQRQTELALLALAAKTRELETAKEELVRKERLALLGQQAAQMAALVQASLALTTETSLERVLQKIADVARDVVGARYAALGVLNESGTALSQFLTSGIDEATKTAIGPLPTGKGILGLLIREPRPIRLRDLSAHPHASGFPPNHPPMRSFLGVAIKVRGKVYGNLYLTEKQDAEEFSDADETVALMLASQAGIVIENVEALERLGRFSQELEQKVEERTRQLREAQEELVRKERLAILGQLAGGVSHELRNPLGVMKNSVYYLKMVLPEDERVRKHLGIMEREVTTATRIVSDLLDFARAKPPSQAPTDLSELVREVLDRTPLAENIRVAAKLAPDLPPISVDALQVQQVLGNLITNGAQAMPEGGTLTIETARAEGGARVAVSDTGVGIPQENLGKIFQPLFTTKAKGIGLGLAVAKGLAEANGGTISVESAVGRGSRFLVVFPQKTKEE